jgi:hypothetical protein
VIIILISLGLIVLSAASFFLPQMHRLKNDFYYRLICSYYSTTITWTFSRGTLIGYNF